ncbi:hypothetical protein [Breoghania sp.]|uniref:hypothetical protein n=1 Tax=Breoghania sp. TaxID=2065378 RepID=UPI0026190141|nr:hypothetical protein [Breoghania sp.]MDJ0930324.1 hypothetical protein [Breoghania sp.]
MAMQLTSTAIKRELYSKIMNQNRRTYWSRTRLDPWSLNINLAFIGIPNRDQYLGTGKKAAVRHSDNFIGIPMRFPIQNAGLRHAAAFGARVQLRSPQPAVD